MENIENSKMKDKKTYERVFPYVWFIEDVSKEINQTQEKKMDPNPKGSWVVPGKEEREDKLFMQD